MINIRTIRKLSNGEGLTLKNGKIITYKTGWQVADEGYETSNPKVVMIFIKAMNGTCGVWYENGIYYVDHSFRVNTKKQALEIGRKNYQISIFGWKRKNLIYI